MKSTTNPAQVYTVFSPKGGVGKTTIAVNLAESLNQAGLKTLLLELDASPGDISTILELERSKNLMLAIDSPDSDIRRLLSVTSDGIQVLLGPQNPEDGEVIKEADLEAVLNRLKYLFDVIVVDTSSTINEAIAAALKRSDRVFFVVEPCLSAVSRSVESLRFLDRRLSIPTDTMELIINKCRNHGAIKEKEVVESLNLTVAALVSFDERYQKRAKNSKGGYAKGSINKATKQVVSNLYPELNNGKLRIRLRRLFG